MVRSFKAVLFYGMVLLKAGCRVLGCCLVGLGGLPLRLADHSLLDPVTCLLSSCYKDWSPNLHSRPIAHSHLRCRGCHDAKGPFLLTPVPRVGTRRLPQSQERNLDQVPSARLGR